jgi:hypothetical protein
MRIAGVAAIRAGGAEAQLVDVGGSTSRRDLLGALAVAPLAAFSTADVGRFGVPIGVSSELVALRRTREGRNLSRVRYRNAESFFAPVEQGFLSRQTDQLYHTGIALQLALSSHLLDVGFDDEWCARSIGLYVTKSLACANATGLGHDYPELRQLAEILSPYGRWRNAEVTGSAHPCPFSHEQVCGITRDLIERVREVTGHSRPRRWR